MAENPLTKLSPLAQAGVAAVAAAVICGAFYFLYWSGAVAEETKKSASLRKLQGEIQELEVTANKLAEFQRQVQLLEADLEKLKISLPTEKQMPDLMKRLQALTQQSSLALRVFSPSKPVQRDFYQELPITMEMGGAYHNLGQLFDRVGRLQRLVTMGNVKLKAVPIPTLSNTVSATVTATTYIYSEAAPSKVPAKAAKPAPAKPPVKK